jgi:hypothetical protein
MKNRNSEKININTTDAETLAKTAGITAAIANKIIAHTSENGPITSESELQNIAGLSKKSFEKIAAVAEYSKAAPKRGIFESTMRNSPGRMKFRITLPEIRDGQATVAFAKTNLLDRNQKPLSALKLNYPVFEGENPFVNFKIPLSRHNPPGTHTLEMVVNDIKQTLTVEIEERVSVLMVPNQFYLENKAGSTIEKDIYISNQGNMPLTVNDPGAVSLETEFIECRMVRDVVHQIRAKKVPFEDLISAFTDKLGNLYEEAGVMRLRFEKPAVIAPGNKVKMKLKIQLPKGLKPGQKYTGTYRLFNAAIVFNIQ